MKTNGQDINAEKMLMMYVECADGNTVLVPLNLKSSSGDEIRFVGEYVDEAYINFLDSYSGSSIAATSELEQAGVFIPESYHFSSFSLSYKANLDDLDDEDYQKRIKERAEQEASERQAYLTAIQEEYMKNGGNSEAEAIAEQTDTMLGAIVDTLKSRDDATAPRCRRPSRISRPCGPISKTSPAACSSRRKMTGFPTSKNASTQENS